MARNKVAIFSSSRLIHNFHIREIEGFFEGLVEVEAYSVAQQIEAANVRCDLALIIGSPDVELVRRMLWGEPEILIAERTILRRCREQIDAIPDDSKVLVASVNQSSAVELTSFLLEDIRVKDTLDYIPLYPGKTPDEAAQYVIYPMDLGVAFDMEMGARQEINLGGRLLMPEVYRVIMRLLNIESEYLDAKLVRYAAELVDVERRNVSLNRLMSSIQLLEQTLNGLDYGVLIYTGQRKVLYYNRTLLTMLEQPTQLEAHYLTSNSLPPPLQEILDAEGEALERIVTLTNGKRARQFLAARELLGEGGAERRYVLTLKDVGMIEQLEAQLRGAIVQKGYVAKYTFKDIIASSEVMKKCLHSARRIAGIDKTALIIGESGTGKELFAQAIHNGSNRRNAAFVAINCGTLSADLLDSELFGYEEGAFTGASKGGKKGLFEMAHKGTIFLDEIGDISPNMQVKLLRVLEESEIRRIGGNKIIPVDVRVIAATNRRLDELVAEGKFRLDLFYRLNAFTIVIPPLRQRRDDIDVLIDVFMRELNIKDRIINQDLLASLQVHEWLGNVRELRNCITYMAYMGGQILTRDHLPPYFAPAPELNLREAMITSDPPPNWQPTEWTDLSSTDSAQLRSVVLEQLRRGRKGRRALVSLCMEQGFAVSEYMMRLLLTELAAKGLVEPGRGRGGARLTSKGVLFLNVDKQTTGENR